LRRALELGPRLPLAHKLYAHLESELGRAPDAMVRLLRLARETRNDAELFAGLVHACRYSGLMEASLAAHREAQRLDPHLPTGVVHTLWQLGDFERVLQESDREGQATRAFALLALGRKREALEAWEVVAQAFSPQTPPVKEWIDSVRDFLSLGEASRPAVFKNLDGAFDPEEVFFVGTQAARLDMPEATSILGRAVDAGYAAWDALVRHPWIAAVREKPGFAEVVDRAAAARARALEAFREAGGPALLGLDETGRGAAASRSAS
jgi:tetratricopeptide (TPR) repeat protein